MSDTSIHAVAGTVSIRASQPDQNGVGNSAASAAADGITRIEDGVTFSPLGEGLVTQSSTDSANPDGGTGGMQPANADGPPGSPPPNV